MAISKAGASPSQGVGLFSRGPVIWGPAGGAVGAVAGSASVRKQPRSSGSQSGRALSGCGELGRAADELAASTERSDFCCGNGSRSCGASSGLRDAGPGRAGGDRWVGLRIWHQILPCGTRKGKSETRPGLSWALHCWHHHSDPQSLLRNGDPSVALSYQDSRPHLPRVLFAGLGSRTGPGWTPSSLPITSRVAPGRSPTLSEPQLCFSVTHA